MDETPFGSEPCGIESKPGSGTLLDNIIMDGEIPFFTEDYFMELERDTQIDNIILDGTGSSGTDVIRDGLILETGFFLKIEDPSLGRESETFNILFEDDGNVKLEGSPFVPLGFHVSNGSKLLLDTLDNDETITLSDIGSLTFKQIRSRDKVEIQGLEVIR